MENRIRALLSALQARADPHERYWVVFTEARRHFVSAATARAIERKLLARRPPEWLKFYDVYGAETVLRTGLIQALEECTVEQRARYRSFWKALEEEDQEEDEKPWEAE